MTGFLEINGISKRYGNFLAVNGVSLTVAEGEFLTFLGPSGSGKSTLLYMIAGLEAASEGDVRLDGTSLLPVPPHKRNIGMVFQRYTLIPHMNVEQNVGFPLRVRGWTSARIEARVAEMLQLVRLEAFAKRRPHQLSGGQQQRVALARALSYEPRILLMDEPLAALDKKLKEEIQIEIRRIHRETGVTVLYVTHDQEEAQRMSDRIAVFNSGRIEQVADPVELYDHPATRFVAGFVGNCNFIGAEITGRINGADAVVLLPDGTQMEPIRMQEDMARGDSAVLLLRPEKIMVNDTASGQGARLRATVTAVTHLGDLLQIDAETSWGMPISARVSRGSMASGTALREGDEVAFSWRAEDALLFRGGT